MASTPTCPLCGLVLVVAPDGETVHLCDGSLPCDDERSGQWSDIEPGSEFDGPVCI